MKKFDWLTLVGLISGIILVTFGIVLASSWAGAKIFISFSSFITVFGGLIASLFVNFGRKELKYTIKSIKSAFVFKQQNINELVEQFVKLATTARREGLLALDSKIDEIEDPFVKKGVLLTVDGLEAGIIKEILLAEIIAIEERQKKSKEVLERAAELSPAWGMIGTLMGLILMLQDLEDPASLGPAMALALITTFYGAILANLVFAPLAGKIGNRSEDEIYIKQIMIEGILGVQSGQNPKLLKEKLEVFIEDIKKEEKGVKTVANEEVAY